MDLEPIWREADETRLQRLADAARGVNKYFMTKYGSIEVSVRGGALSCRLHLCVTNIGSCVFAPTQAAFAAWTISGHVDAWLSHAEFVAGMEPVVAALELDPNTTQELWENANEDDNGELCQCRVCTARGHVDNSNCD